MSVSDTNRSGGSSHVHGGKTNLALSGKVLLATPVPETGSRRHPGTGHLRITQTAVMTMPRKVSYSP